MFLVTHTPESADNYNTVSVHNSLEGAYVGLMFAITSEVGDNHTTSLTMIDGWPLIVLPSGAFYDVRPV